MQNINKIIFKWLGLYAILASLIALLYIIAIFHFSSQFQRNYIIGGYMVFLIIVAVACKIGSKYLWKIICNPHNIFKYHELIENVPQSIFETDENGKFSFANKKFLERFGYAATDIAEMNLSIHDIIITDSTDKIYNETKFLEADMLGVRIDGSLFPVTIHSNYIYLNNKIKGIRGIIIDNTERMKYIKDLQDAKISAEELDNLKSTFLANISNEIRTPINTILGFSNLAVLQDCSEEKRNDYINHIITNSERLLEIIDDVNDITKIDMGELKIAKCRFDLNELIFEIFSYFQAIARQN